MPTRLRAPMGGCDLGHAKAATPAVPPKYSHTQWMRQHSLISAGQVESPCRGRRRRGRSDGIFWTSYDKGLSEWMMERLLRVPLARQLCRLSPAYWSARIFWASNSW